MSVYRLKGRDISLHEIRGVVEAQNRDFGSFIEEFVAFSYQHVLAPGDVAIDGGAARGWHTFDMAKHVGPQGRVHAFDPLPDYCEFLKMRSRNWRFNDRVMVHELALGVENGTTQFHRVVEHPGLSGIKRAWAPADAQIEIVEVAVRRLEEVIPVEEWPRLSFVKLDLEGGEFTALKFGADKMIAAARPVVAFESGRLAAATLYGYSEDDFFAFFEQLNYDLYDIFGGPFTREIFSSNFAGEPSEFIAIPREKRALELNGKLSRRLEESVG